MSSEKKLKMLCIAVLISHEQPLTKKPETQSKNTAIICHCRNRLGGPLNHSKGFPKSANQPRAVGRISHGWVRAPDAWASRGGEELFPQKIFKNQAVEVQIS